MANRELDGIAFKDIVSLGARLLSQRAKDVDALNVFPVPDGDTGTNMSLSLASGVEEMKRQPSPHIGEVAHALSRGLLMGARGNSGVILSQLIRGFAKEIRHCETITVLEFALALQRGVDTAYQAVIKPVEGTILTVARDAASRGVTVARETEDIQIFFSEVLKAAQESLQRTPERLPILKQTGVVDAGGQGLVYFYEGMLAGLTGGNRLITANETIQLQSLTEHAHQKTAQSNIATEDIPFGYCTEFIIELASDFDENAFRDYLNARGDSLLYVRDDSLIKVHIHTEEPLKIVEYGTTFGDLRTVKIENMRAQHRAIVEGDAVQPERRPIKRYGIVAVAVGKGIADVFQSLGVDEVIEGGQTMNPSTEHIVNALNKINAEHLIVLPNNSNIVMAAEQAAKVVKRPTTVIPSKTIPQGLAAMLAFNPDASLEENEKTMREAVTRVVTGQVTYAVRDSQVSDMAIKKGDYIGIEDGEIRVHGPTLNGTAEDLLTALVSDEHEIVTIFYGEDVDEQQAESLKSFAVERFPHLEVELLNGKQPLYYYLFAVE